MVKDLKKIEILKDNLISNIESFRKNISTKNQKIIAVVKGNAYGVGLREVVQIVKDKVDGFQVNSIEELREVRKYTKKPVYVFGYVLLSQIKEAIYFNGILGVYDFEHLEKINQIAKKEKRIIKVHLKIDSYLGRQGVLVSEVDELLQKIKDFKNILIEAVYSHFSNIEDVDNLIHAKKQFEGLIKAKEKIESFFGIKIFHHISATSGFLSDQKENWGSSFIRLGIGMYGFWPSINLKKRYEKKIKLRPVLRWVTYISQVKEIPNNYPVGYGLSFVSSNKMKVAIIPVGYSDGYDRGFSNNGEVLISGKKVKILGRVAMNMFAVDVTNIKNVNIEDRVVLLGEDFGSEISADTLSFCLGTINYEIIARISPLIKRVVL